MAPVQPTLRLQQALPEIRIRASPELDDLERSVAVNIVTALIQLHPDSSFRAYFPHNNGSIASAFAVLGPSQPYAIKGLYLGSYCTDRFTALMDLLRLIRDQHRAETPMAFSTGGHATFTPKPEVNEKHVTGSVGTMVVKTAYGAIISDVEANLQLNKKNERELTRTAQILLRSAILAAHIANPKYDAEEMDVHVHRFQDNDPNQNIQYYRASIAVNFMKPSKPDEKFSQNSVALRDLESNKNCGEEQPNPSLFISTGPLARSFVESIRLLRKTLVQEPAKHVRHSIWKIGDEAEAIWDCKSVESKTARQIPRGKNGKA